MSAKNFAVGDLGDAKNSDALPSPVFLHGIRTELFLHGETEASNPLEVFQSRRNLKSNPNPKEDFMKHSFLLIFSVVFLVFVSDAAAQNRRRALPKPKNPVAVKTSNQAVVVDERLAVLRVAPGFSSKIVQRMRRGRNVTIFDSKQADGATFYRIAAAPNSGWVQAEAVVGKSRTGDDARLAKLAQSSKGFDQIERGAIFLETFRDSSLRPAILLLVGDLMEETALKLSADATRQFDRREMAATGAPLHTFYLNYTSLDRYRRLDMNFLFNSNTKLFHYDGANWREIVKKFPSSAEAAEAQKRLDALKEKMEATK